MTAKTAAYWLLSPEPEAAKWRTEANSLAIQNVRAQADADLKHSRGNIVIPPSEINPPINVGKYFTIPGAAAQPASQPASELTRGQINNEWIAADGAGGAHFTIPGAI